MLTMQRPLYIEYTRSLYNNAAAPIRAAKRPTGALCTTPAFAPVGAVVAEELALLDISLELAEAMEEDALPLLADAELAEAELADDAEVALAESDEAEPVTLELPVMRFEVARVEAAAPEAEDWVMPAMRPLWVPVAPLTPKLGEKL